MIDYLKPRNNVGVKTWIPIGQIESSAIDQLRNVSDLAPAFEHIAAMPDVHTGMGATIGSVIALKGAVIPSAVGVDIGCGMSAVKTNLNHNKLSVKKLEKIKNKIIDLVPVGFNSHNFVLPQVKSLAIWQQFDGFREEFRQHKDRAMSQVGTLGGGNHFIEITKDQDNNVWVIIHSGSRYIGKTIADYHIKKAIELNQVSLPDKSLAYFTEDTPEFKEYMVDLMWAQTYAKMNRNFIMGGVLSAISKVFSSLKNEFFFDCHHNFATREKHFDEDLIVIRKGAIQATVGQWGLIPGAMGSNSYVVTGRGNEESFCSAPHGAGRKMSRSKAKKKYGLDELNKTMNNVVCNASKKTVDEIKFAYKNIDKVIEYASELVDIKYSLTPLLNIKG